jgi:hypothetical protein
MNCVAIGAIRNTHHPFALFAKDGAFGCRRTRETRGLDFPRVFSNARCRFFLNRYRCIYIY